MKVAVLPFNVAEGTQPALGRQISALAAETVRTATGADVQSISYLTQIQDEGVTRAAHVNMGNSIMEHEFFVPLFKEAGADRVMHGLLQIDGDQFSLHLRIEAKDSESPCLDQQITFTKGEIFSELFKLTKVLADQAEVALPPEVGPEIKVGTDNPDALIEFLTGYDGLQFIQQTNGAVAKEFDPRYAMEALLRAIEIDGNFQAPFEVAIQLCRASAHYKLGNFDDSERTL